MIMLFRSNKRGKDTMLARVPNDCLRTSSQRNGSSKNTLSNITFPDRERDHYFQCDRDGALEIIAALASTQGSFACDDIGATHFSPEGKEANYASALQLLDAARAIVLKRKETSPVR